MAKTSDELILRALTKVGVVSQGQTPTNDDRELVADQINPLLEQLARMDVVYIPDPDNIDESVFLPLALRLALQIGSDFGLPEMTLEQELSANFRIRIAKGQSTIMAPLRADYF